MCFAWANNATESPVRMSPANEGPWLAKPGSLAVRAADRAVDGSPSVRTGEWLHAGDAT